MGSGAKIKDKLSALRKLQSKHPLLFAHVADCYLKLGNLNAAKKILKNGIAKFLEYPTGWAVEGQYFLLRSQPEKARMSFKKVIKLDPINCYAHERCSEIAADFSDHMDYRKHIEALSRLDPLDDNIQKMHQAEELRLIAVDNGLFTPEDAEKQVPGALRKALLEQNLVPDGFRRSIDRDMVSMQFTEFNIGDDSEEDDDVPVESPEQDELSVFESAPAEEEIDTYPETEDSNLDTEVELTESVEEPVQVISERAEEADGDDWFDDAVGEPQEAQSPEEFEVPRESDSADYAVDEVEEDVDASVSGVAWAQTVSEDDADAVEEIDEFPASAEPSELYDSAPAEEIDLPPTPKTEPKSFAEFEALQKTSQTDAEDDQPAKPVFDIQSLGIVEADPDESEDIPVLTGLDDASADPGIEESIDIMAAESSDVPGVVEGLESHAGGAYEEDYESAAKTRRKQPDMESTLSQMIDSDVGEEEMSEIVETSAVEPPEQDSSQMIDSDVGEEEMPEIVETSAVEPPEQDSSTDIITATEEQEFPQEDPAQSAESHFPVDEGVKRDLEEIAAEVTGVKPEKSVEASSEPEPQKPKRIATKTLAELYASQGEWGRAIVVYEELLARHTENDAYKQRLEGLRSKLG